MVLQLVVCSEPHPSPGIERIEKALREVRVDRPRQVEGRRAARHYVGVRWDGSLLAGELALGFHGEDRDRPEQREVRLVYRLLNTRPSEALHTPPMHHLN